MRLSRPTPAMIVALLALLVALSGTSYAAIKIGTKDLRDNSVTSPKIKDKTIRSKDISAKTRQALRTVPDGSLTLANLGSGSFGEERTTTVQTPIILPGGACKAQLTGNFGDAVEGFLVLSTLTDANGDAVLPNTAATVPSTVIKTTQGGAVPNLVVCNTGNGNLTVPAGSVFHWRLVER